MSRLKTFILAPNFHLTFDTSSSLYPWLGNIIPDPLNPTRRTLDKLPPDRLPQNTVSVQEEDNVYTATKGRTLNASIWANFLQTASAKAGGEVEREETIRYSMKGGIETRYFEPTDEEVTRRVAESARIRAAMNSGLFGRQPVYMITGLKIAKGFEFESDVSSGAAGTAGGSVPVAPEGEASLGAELGGSATRKEGASWKMGGGQDIIFAYQVHIIAAKGWREMRKRIEVDVYHSKQAFLGKRDDGDDFNTMEATVASKELLESEARLGRTMKSIKAVAQDGDQYYCVVPPGEE